MLRGYQAVCLADWSALFYSLYGFSGLGRRSNPPQHSHKPKTNPELGPNSNSVKAEEYDEAE